MRAASAACVLGVMVMLGLAHSGCVTAKKYRMAKKDTAPAPTLDWKVSAASADLAVHSVIVFKGPGSWKREARWDEYVVSLGNRGSAPLELETAVLIDLLGMPRACGTDPWRLEKLSYTNWEKYGKTGLQLAAGAGAVALYAGAVVATSLGGIMAPAAAAGGGVALLNIIPVVAVVDVTAVAIMNSQNKRKVADEFNRRLLRLPLRLAPGETVAGSLFFPMTPGPRQLLLRGRCGEETVELALDLKPLAGLHLKPAAEKAARQP